jgi:hypothetical protein
MTEQKQVNQQEHEATEEAYWSPTHPEDGIYEIPAENLGKLQKKLKTLANKAEKLGLPAPELEIVGERLVPIEKHYEGKAREQQEATGLESGRKRKVYDVRVSGQSPIIEGWMLIAVIDHYSSGERGVNLIRRYPQETEVEVPEEFRTVNQRCDHCQTQRNRKDTFLLSEVETAELKLVGRQCLKDFLGHQSPEALANYARFILDLMGAATDESWGGNGWQTWYLDLEELLTTTAAVIRLHGWLGRTKAREWNRDGEATADLALTSLNAKRKEHRVEITDEDRYLAKQTILWTREVLAGQDQLNDYEWNLLASTSNDELEYRNVGIAASAVYAYMRAQSLLKERERSNGERWGENSQHQGEVGKRYDLVLTVQRMLPIDTDWGMLYITVMTDEADNVYVWRTGAEKMEEGRTYNVRGTVKEHGDYNGTAQTILSRCKVTCAKCGTLDYSWKSSGMICHGCNLLEKKERLVGAETDE